MDIHCEISCYWGKSGKCKLGRNHTECEEPFRGPELVENPPPVKRWKPWNDMSEEEKLQFSKDWWHVDGDAKWDIEARRYVPDLRLWKIRMSGND